MPADFTECNPPGMNRKECFSVHMDFKHRYTIKDRSGHAASADSTDFTKRHPNLDFYKLQTSRALKRLHAVYTCVIWECNSCFIFLKITFKLYFHM